MSFAVIGLGFGDEGKGLVVDYLCAQSLNPIVVRFSGGHQAGHTVVYNGIRHIFSNFGSGTLRGVPTYFSEFCTISPIGIRNEYNILKEKGITPKLYINKNCPVVTPFDQYHNQKRDQALKHGTCGVGFGSTIEREEDNIHLTFLDLFYPHLVLEIKETLIKEYYYSKDFCLNLNLDMQEFYEACKFLTSCEDIIIANDFNSQIGYVFHKDNDEYHDFTIFEGSQGLLLDKEIGFFPYVTRSNTGTKNLLKVCRDTPKIYAVTRAYQTRHGNGPMTNEDIPHNIKLNPFETNITNKYQGDFRRSLLDLDLIEYGIRKDGHTTSYGKWNLVITCLDHIENEYRFTYKQEIVNCDNEADFIKKIAIILHCDKILISRSDESKNIEDFKI